ncbi:isochorismatase family cysteine hydrolase [Aeribacillus pallidus]|uniref:isochorismatase family cysteine hydrolase n=1 Tax=Aeribacillus pallidus TaxID=33936 RepID=UPI003D24CBB6
MKSPSNVALLIIDIINSFRFGHGPILAERTLSIVPRIKALKEVCRKKQIPIIYINDNYNIWRADVQKLIKHCTNDLSSPIINELHPDDSDYFLIKPKYSAFFGTGLNPLLSQLNIKQLILTGIAGNICVLFTANDAYMRDYRLFVPADCITSVDPKDNEYALKMMNYVLDARIDPSDQLISLLSHF